MLNAENNVFVEVFMFVIGAFGLVAYPPQIWQLYRTKQSEDINVWSWMVWAITYILFAAYAFVFTSSWVLFILNVIEFILCSWVVLLVLKYKNLRHKSRESKAKA